MTQCRKEWCEMIIVGGWQVKHQLLPRGCSVTFDVSLHTLSIGAHVLLLISRAVLVFGKNGVCPLSL